MLRLHFFTKKAIFALCGIASFCTVGAQKKNFDYRFYGFVRGDIYYNSRSNVEGVDGLFYLYPKDKSYDADGKDLNATPNGSFYTLATRLGLDMNGPDVGTAKTSAKIETDFGGTANMHFMLRLRQAYVKLEWQKGSSLLLGQTWHPLFGDVIPSSLNLSTGSPFQPFNRSPQINYQYRQGKLRLTTSAVYQLMYTSYGPEGRGEQYLKNGLIPELYAGVDYKMNHFLIGAGIDMISLKPRLQSVYDGQLFSVNERVTSFSYDLHAEYVHDKLKISGRTILASNQGHNAMIGGYGVTEIDSRTGKQDYTSFQHSTSWINFVYGKKYQGCLFAGYTKNLGTPDNLVSTNKLYGSGLDIDQFMNLSFCMRYVLPHWNIGLEYSLATAWYGDMNLSNGKVINTHDVSNHRIESVFIYTF